MPSDYVKGITTGILSGVIIGVVGAGFLYTAQTRLIPRNEKVQQGYAAPKTLEIRCDDLDQNGELETYL